MPDQGGSEGAPPQAAGQAEARPPSLLACFLGLGAVWVLLVVIGQMVRRVDFAAWGGSWMVQAGGVVALAAVAAGLWEVRRWLMRTVTSLAFSAALITCILVATAIGTVIVQQAPAEAYAQRHGQALSAALLFLGMDDLFHSVWFGGLLALVGVSLVLTAIEKRAWRLHMWGHMLSHLGFVVVLIGGLIGRMHGFKGFIDIHEGQEVREAQVVRADGSRGGSHPLGFGLKLERFAVEHYTPEAKFYVYARDGESFRTVGILDPRKELPEGGPLRPIGDSGASVRLLKIYPDFYLRPEVRPAPAGSGGPVLQIDFQQGEWNARAALQPQAGSEATGLSAAGPRLRLLAVEPSAEEQARFAQAAPQTHHLAVQGVDGAEVPIALGQSASLPAAGLEVQALEYLPDFSYDAKLKQATSRSPEPNNPALRVQITERTSGQTSTRWLFAKLPNFGHDGAESGPRLLYIHRPAQAPEPRELLVIAATGQIWLLERGVVKQRLPLAEWRSLCAGLPVTGMQLHAAAVVEPVPTSRTAEWDNPAADIEVVEEGKTRQLRVTAEHSQPIAFAERRFFLAFEVRRDDPKAFRSHLSVIDGGATVAEKTIVVNDPLTYKGYMFYQSNFRKDDPTYSGIQVVRDPGLGVVFAGFIMMSLGVVFIYYIRPRILAGGSHGH